ncbi:MAG: hypothetical protein IKC46_00550 [Lachnospiraceae bacterium]|nr:hypothetical protein [Lachnospiraceae bacterium]
MKNIKLVNAQKPVLATLLGACMEDVNHELYGGIWSQMIFGEAFEEPAAEGCGVSGMWQPFGEGTQELVSGGFSGSNRQVLKNAGVYNRGLNKSGMYFKEGKEYRGYLIAKADAQANVTVSLRGADPAVVYAETSFSVSGDWKKYEFTLTAKKEEIDGCFGIFANGEAAIGYVFLETGEWGLYKGLHVRRDVGEALENMGIGILRFGGCMANAKDYLWKNMTGAPECRKPYKGWWYPYSSYGFGILEFIELCEKLGVVCVPDFNAYETEEDMRDFVQYAIGTDENNPWVQLRMASSHPQPYKLEYIQFGNEEKVEEDFADRFIAACRGVWSVSRDITMVIGDFAYLGHPFEDPFNIPEECTYSKITTLAPQQRILKYAIENGMAGKVWFDIHWTSDHGDSPLPYPECTWSLMQHLDRIVPGHDTKLCVFELNADHHDWERGMTNAYSILEGINHSEIIPCMCSANCLQVDKHNDNGWNQGLLFMNNRSVWYQAPGYVDILFKKMMLERRFDTDDSLADGMFNYTAMTDGKKISVILLNRSDNAEEVCLELPVSGTYSFEKTVMTYAKEDVNTAENNEYINISNTERGSGKGNLCVTLPANTIMAYMIG